LNYCQLLKAELAPWSYLSVIYNWITQWLITDVTFNAVEF
jgi:hypothetical protein